MKKLLSILFVLLLLVSSLLPFKTSAMPHPQMDGLPCNKLTTNLKMAERKLWSEHAFWTRNLVISDIYSLPDKEAVLQRLLTNQDDIGNSIKPYYGEQAGNKLAKLLREHILLAVKVVNAAKTGNKTALATFNKEWYRNADDIATFLNKANPNWSKATLTDMLHKHLQILTKEVVARLNKDWQANIKATDKGEEHLLQLADELSRGIIKQFPAKFK